MSKDKYTEIFTGDEEGIIENQENQPMKEKQTVVEYVAENKKPLAQGFVAGTLFGALLGSVGTAIALHSDDSDYEYDEDESEDSEDAEDNE